MKPSEGARIHLAAGHYLGATLSLARNWKEFKNKALIPSPLVRSEQAPRDACPRDCPLIQQTQRTSTNRESVLLVSSADLQGLISPPVWNATFLCDLYLDVQTYHEGHKHPSIDPYASSKPTSALLV